MMRCASISIRVSIMLMSIVVPVVSCRGVGISRLLHRSRSLLLLGRVEVIRRVGLESS